jgi:hypothetical protein
MIEETFFNVRLKLIRLSLGGRNTPRSLRWVHRCSVILSSPPKQSSDTMAKRKAIQVEQMADGSWHLVHPRCALARQEDIEEVEAMIAAGEVEIARDELRWLLGECHDFLAAHKLLGDLALTDGDVRLARGHYGYAYQLGIQAIDHTGEVKSLPYAQAANQVFFQAGRGLVTCLQKMNKHGMARDVISRLVQLDAGDPLGLKELQGQTKSAPKNRRRK